MVLHEGSVESYAINPLQSSLFNIHSSYLLSSPFTLPNFTLHHSLFQISQVGFHLLDEKSDTKVAL